MHAKPANALQAQIQDAIDRLVESGVERGLQVAVYQHGELVVDAVAGLADSETGRAVTRDTLFHSFSTGKGAAATVVHVLAERGLLGYDTPIAELWPEFGAHGKGRATVRHALTHSVGVPGVPLDTRPEDLAGWQKMTTLIADAEPWWEPGEKSGYHAMTYGFILGEIVRRATGKPISQVLLEEVTGPLGIAAGLFFGLPREELGRLARLEDSAEDFQLRDLYPAGAPFFKVGPAAFEPSAALGNREDLLTADIPSIGTMTARAAACMYAALMGEVGGTRLVSPARLREITALEVSGIDQILELPTFRSLGYGLGGPSASTSDHRNVFGFGGAGGSYACGNTATGTAFAVTKNRLAADFSTAAQIDEIVARAAGK